MNARPVAVPGARAPAPGPWTRLRRSRTTRWTFWKYHWIIYHRTIEALERARVHVQGDLLDIGCGDRPFEWVFAGRAARSIGTDLKNSAYLDARPPDVHARSEQLPFRDASFDTVVGLSMITYLPEPLAVLREANRLLRPGGTLVMEFTQMVPLHDPPWDFFRYTRYGAGYLLERAGFEPVEFIPIAGLWTRVGMSVISGLNRINRGPARVLTEIPVRLLYAVLQPAFAVLDRLFFDPREVVGHLVVARRSRDAGPDDPARALAAVVAAAEAGSQRAAGAPDGSSDAR